MLELTFRLVGIYLTSEERQGFDYVYKYYKKETNRFHTWTPNSKIHIDTKEFNYTNSYNEWGHREKPVYSFNKTDKIINTICIGDSFTEGDGTSYDSTWVKRVEHLLNKDTLKYALYNAGVCGSDVFYDYQILSQKLIELHPKIVLASINYSDVYDVIYQGGDNRFNSDNTVSGKTGPTWEWAFKYSHVFRAITLTALGYNKYLIKKSEQESKEIEAVELIKKKIYQTRNFCVKHGINYILIIHPHPLEINFNKNKLTNALGKEPYVIDLFQDQYLYYKQHNIAFNSWPLNHHFNGRGYFVLGTQIAQHLKQHGMLITSSIN
ncbi:MAG: SGNH/GDSL hydrolase family protein [bacterium]|nr:SGNH/GDSL hydrolase family protein [bacterium]